MIDSILRDAVGGFRVWTDFWVRSGWRAQRHPDGEIRLLDASDRVVRKGTLADCIAEGRRSAPQARARKAAVLLHGMGHHRGVMNGIEADLVSKGWAVANMGYASLNGTVEEHAIAASTVAFGMASEGAAEVSFVGHSLGGLVARAAASRARADRWKAGRLVLIASPANGAQAASMISLITPFRMFAGPCAATVSAGGATAVPVPMCNGIAVIAGGNGGRGYNPLLKGDNDGVVTVTETRMPGSERDFLLVAGMHTPLPGKQDVIDATARFLDTGRLRPPLR